MVGAVIFVALDRRSARAGKRPRQYKASKRERWFRILLEGGSGELAIEPWVVMLSEAKDLCIANSNT